MKLMSLIIWLCAIFMIVSCSGISGPSDNSKPATRTVENINSTFSKSRDRIYRIYSQRLKSEPNLKGRVVYQLVIAGNGKVTEVNIQSTTLNDPIVEQLTAAVISDFNFGPLTGASDVRVTYPVDYLPN